MKQSRRNGSTSKSIFKFNKKKNKTQSSEIVGKLQKSTKNRTRTDTKRSREEELKYEKALDRTRVRALDIRRRMRLHCQRESLQATNYRNKMLPVMVIETNLLDEKNAAYFKYASDLLPGQEFALVQPLEQNQRKLIWTKAMKIILGQLVGCHIKVLVQQAKHNSIGTKLIKLRSCPFSISMHCLFMSRLKKQKISWRNDFLPLQPVSRDTTKEFKSLQSFYARTVYTDIEVHTRPEGNRISSKDRDIRRSYRSKFSIVDTRFELLLSGLDLTVSWGIFE